MKQTKLLRPYRYDLQTNKLVPVNQNDWDLQHEISMRMYELDPSTVIQVSKQVEEDRNFRMKSIFDSFGVPKELRS